MLNTLRDAFQKQENHEHIGQIDLDGSFTALLKRELIDLKTISDNGKRGVSWYITSEGLKTLNRLGFDEPEI